MELFSQYLFEVQSIHEREISNLKKTLEIEKMMHEKQQKIESLELDSMKTENQR